MLTRLFRGMGACVVFGAAGEGLLKKLPVDFKDVLRENAHIYNLYEEPK